MEFNMGKFILKMIFSIGICVLLVSQTHTDKLLYNIFSGIAYFLLGYLIATIFGFTLNVTGNYIIAAILFFIAFAASIWGVTMLSGLGTIGEILMILLLVWPPISDIRKAILYIKDGV